MWIYSSIKEIEMEICFIDVAALLGAWTNFTGIHLPMAEIDKRDSNCMLAQAK